MNRSAALVALVPAAVVAVTSTVPVPDGDVAVQVVEAQVTLVAELVPKSIVAPERLVPVTVTTVPPAPGPCDGEMAVIVGRGLTLTVAEVEVEFAWSETSDIVALIVWSPLVPEETSTVRGIVAIAAPGAIGVVPS